MRGKRLKAVKSPASGTSALNEGCETFALGLKLYPHIPAVTREYRFHEERKWRFDFAWPEWKIAVEIEGGTFSQGRHTRGVGFADDCRKYNSAALLGWRLFRFTTGQVKAGYAIDTMIEVFHFAR